MRKVVPISLRALLSPLSSSQDSGYCNQRDQPCNPNQQNDRLDKKMNRSTRPAEQPLNIGRIT